MNTMKQLCLTVMILCLRL